ncbi:hypothetical protein KBD61_02650 [Patescibacteria group bacterium]|nr:hypothetical protein [Patescibacteria group bacterium]MBP9709904.1 hypothetical protein [Patescibacteria group bacterium]
MTSFLSIPRLGLRSFRSLFVGAFFLAMTMLPVMGQAQGLSSVSGGLNAAARTGGLGDFCRGTAFNSCLATITGTVINVVLGLSGIILLGYILYAGFLWMTSGGEMEKAKQARTMIVNAVIGLIILVSAFAISSFVLGALSRISQGGTAPTAPAAVAPVTPAGVPAP